MLLSTQQCYTCGKETKHFNGKCGDCESKIRHEDRKNHFLYLKSLTLEQRVERIEKILYEQSSLYQNEIDRQIR